MPESAVELATVIRRARDAGVKVEKYPAVVITVKHERGKERDAQHLEETLTALGFVAPEATARDHMGTYFIREWVSRSSVPYSQIPIP